MDQVTNGTNKACALWSTISCTQTHVDATFLVRKVIPALEAAKPEGFAEKKAATRELSSHTRQRNASQTPQSCSERRTSVPTPQLMLAPGKLARRD